MTIEYVDFPALGLRIPVIRTLFQIFGQYIYTYAVIIALSIVLMIILGLRHAERFGINKDFIIDFMIFAIPASIICARVYYVIFSWDSYKNDLLAIFNIRQGGIAIYGAVIGAIITVVIFSKVRKMDALRFLDFGVPYLLLAQGIGRWGNFVNQEVFGVNTTLPWGMTGIQISAYLTANMQKLAELGITVDPSLPVHPTFLYESLWNFLIAFFLFRLRKRGKYKGEVLLGYLIGYGAGRAFIEGLRTDSLMLGGFRVSQLISVVLVLVCLAVIVIFRGKFKLYADDPVMAAAAAADTIVTDETVDVAETDTDDTQAGGTDDDDTQACGTDDDGGTGNADEPAGADDTDACDTDADEPAGADDTNADGPAGADEADADGDDGADDTDADGPVGADDADACDTPDDGDDDV